MTVLAAAASAAAASASPGLLLGLTDEANTLYGNPDTTFPLLDELGVQALRVNLYWGGTPWAVAKQRPADGADPADPAYDWTVYDRFVRTASEHRIRVVFSVLFTPAWANGGRARNVAPASGVALRQFAYAAALRYSGSYDPGGGAGPLPAVRLWTAWNEPNNPVFLSPQFRGRAFAGAQAYVRICDAVYGGVHATGLAGEQVACGVTSPRGNDAPASSRPSVSPLAFLRAVKRYGLRRFDVWAHHPYPTAPARTPLSRPVDGTIELGNIDTLLGELSRLYGPKHLWITELGYQTNPPDTFFGVSYARQALYLRQSVAIARRNPRIDMMLWFLLRDEPSVSGWQSGLLTVAGMRKPSFAALAALTH